MRSRWLWFMIAILAGVGLGLLVGWVISPVKYVNTTPDSLGADYKTDYVLMVAETYQSESSLAMATQRLALLGKEPDAQKVQAALSFAIGANYSSADITLLSRLLQAYQAVLPTQTPKGGS
jgi:hypothetical protein